MPRTLFLGRGTSAVCWYRIALPAMALGCDWFGTNDDPERLGAVTGQSAAGDLVVRPLEYDVLIVQLVAGRRWASKIREWRAAGKTVLYEVDDWIRGVRRNKHHDFRDTIDKAAVRDAELCMAACDGVICSTPWLARRYAAVNPQVFVCRNGIDLRRYALTRPERSQVAIGWAGATGHGGGIVAWRSGIEAVMREHDATRFISVGQPFAELFEPEFGVGRTMSVPFAALDTYPAAMALFDVALAPAGKGNFFRGKSDLRWLEASALGIPIVADPLVYPDIEHGVTGFHAETAAEVAEHLGTLVADPELRRQVGEQARAHVTEHRRMEVAAESWAQVVREVAAAPVAA